MPRAWLTILWLVLFAGSVHPAEVAAQTDVRASVLSTAGGLTRSGSLTLISTIGQPSPVGLTSGGSFTVRSGQLPSTAVAPPSEPIAIQHAPPAQQAQGEGFQLVAEITGPELDQVELAYRRGGEATFTVEAMTPSGSTYTGTIPAAFVTDQGLAYFIRAVGASGHTVRVPAVGTYSVHVNVPEPGLMHTLPIPGGQAQSSYRLLSVPLVLAEPQPATVLSDDLGAYDDTQWRFFELRFDQSVAELPDAAAMTPGKAFWLITSEGGRTIDTGAGQTALLNQPFRHALHPQWNLVGNPFNFPIPVENLRMASGQPFELRAFEGSWNDPINNRVAVMQPFTGYALFNNLQAVDSLRITPTPAATENMQKTAPASKPNWFVRILAESRTARDTDNLAGVMPDAALEADAYDLPEPPVIGSFVSVYFPRPSWNHLADRFATDLRPPPAGGHVWPFEVASNVDDAIRLTFRGLDQVPEEFEVWLVDEQMDLTQNVRSTPRYSFPASGQPKQLKLVVGRPAFIDGELGTLREAPTAYEAPRNFPNPFRTNTAIHYTLPQAERVTLDVYSVLGEKVITLLNEAPQEAGRHLVMWEGTTSEGYPVASGLYLVRFRTDAFTATTTAVVIR